MLIWPMPLEPFNRQSHLNPEFKDFAQIWRWQMITVHERCTGNHQVRTAENPVRASVVEKA
jgi:hypothetical protein